MVVSGFDVAGAADAVYTVRTCTLAGHRLSLPKWQQPQVTQTLPGHYIHEEAQLTAPGFKKRFFKQDCPVVIRGDTPSRGAVSMTSACPIALVYHVVLHVATSTTAMLWSAWHICMLQVV